MDIDQTNENNIKYDKDEGILDYARPYELYYDNNRNNIEEEFNSTNMTNISRINNNILTEGYLFKIQENKVKNNVNNRPNIPNIGFFNCCANHVKKKKNSYKRIKFEK